MDPLESVEIGERVDSEGRQTDYDETSAPSEPQDKFSCRHTCEIITIVLLVIWSFIVVYVANSILRSETHSTKDFTPSVWGWTTSPLSDIFPIAVADTCISGSSEISLMNVFGSLIDSPSDAHITNWKGVKFCSVSYLKQAPVNRYFSRRRSDGTVTCPENHILCYGECLDASMTTLCPITSLSIEPVVDPDVTTPLPPYQFTADDEKIYELKLVRASADFTESTQGFVYSLAAASQPLPPQSSLVTLDDENQDDDDDKDDDKDKDDDDEDDVELTYGICDTFSSTQGQRTTPFGNPPELARTCTRFDPQFKRIATLSLPPVTPTSLLSSEIMAGSIDKTSPDAYFFSSNLSETEYAAFKTGSLVDANSIPSLYTSHEYPIASDDCAFDRFYVSIPANRNLDRNIAFYLYLLFLVELVFIVISAAFVGVRAIGSSCQPSSNGADVRQTEATSATTSTSFSRTDITCFRRLSSIQLFNVISIIAGFFAGSFLLNMRTFYEELESKKCFSGDLRAHFSSLDFSSEYKSRLNDLLLWIIFPKFVFVIVLIILYHSRWCFSRNEVYYGSEAAAPRPPSQPRPQTQSETSPDDIYSQVEMESPRTRTNPRPPTSAFPGSNAQSRAHIETKPDELPSSSAYGNVY